MSAKTSPIDIVDLRAQVDRQLANPLSENRVTFTGGMAVRVVDEIERLRAALAEIVRFNDECAAEPDPDTGFDPNGPLMTRARELANG